MFQPRYYDPVHISFEVGPEDWDPDEYRDWAIRRRLGAAGLSKSKQIKYQRIIHTNRIAKSMGTEQAIENIKEFFRQRLSA